MKAKVKCIHEPYYNDLELKERKYKGDEYTVSLERAEYLKEHNAVEILEVIKEEKSEIEELKEEKPNKKKSSKK